MFVGAWPLQAIMGEVDPLKDHRLTSGVVEDCASWIILLAEEDLQPRLLSKEPRRDARRTRADDKQLKAALRRGAPLEISLDILNHLSPLLYRAGDQAHTPHLSRHIKAPNTALKARAELGDVDPPLSAAKDETDSSYRASLLAISMPYALRAPQQDRPSTHQNQGEPRLRTGGDTGSRADTAIWIYPGMEGVRRAHASAAHLLLHTAVAILLKADPPLDPEEEEGKREQEDAQA